MTVTNRGPGPARSVLLSDPLPAGASLLSAVPSVGACTVTGSPVALACALGTFAPAASATVVITARVAADRTGVLTNVAGAVSPDESNPEDNTAAVSLPVTAVATLTLAKKVVSGAALAGHRITWQLVATNTGPAVAPGVVLTDPLPTGLSSIEVSDGCALNGLVVTCRAGTLAVGDGFTATVSAVIAPAARGSLVNSATAGSQLPSATGRPARATVTTPIGIDSHLTLTKSADRAEVEVGAPVTYTIIVTQTGLSTSNPVTVLEHLPANGSVTAAAVSQGTFDTATSRWAVGAVDRAHPAILKLTLTFAGPGPR